MNEEPHICVICGDYLNLDLENVVVDVLPSPEGTIQRVVHKECIENIKKDIFT